MMMKKYSGGDIVLLDFAFSSGAGSKKRPGLILLDTGDDDILVAKITSRAAKRVFEIQIADWKGAGLLQPSLVRMNKIATFEKTGVLRQLGTLEQADWARVRIAVKNMWASL